MMIMRILLLGFADVAHDRDDDDHGYDASGQGTKTILSLALFSTTATIMTFKAEKVCRKATKPNHLNGMESLLASLVHCESDY